VPTNFDLIDWQHLLGRNPNYHSIAKCCSDNSEEGWRDDKSEDSKVKKNMRYERYISDTRSGNKYQETRKFQRSKRQY
ncbi:hypothetical protein MAR_005506, partial [Mya arenaria]